MNTTPVNLTATPGDGQVALRCDPVLGASGYAWYQSLFAPGVSTAPSTPLGNTQNPEFVDNSVSNGNTYYYSVTAVDATGEGPHSAVVSATPQAVVAAAPAPAPTPLPPPAPAPRPALAQRPTPAQAAARPAAIVAAQPAATPATPAAAPGTPAASIAPVVAATPAATPTIAAAAATAATAAAAPAGGGAPPAPRTVHLPAAALPGRGAPAATTTGTATPTPTGTLVSRGLMALAALLLIIAAAMLVKQLMSDGPTPRSLGALGVTNATNTELADIQRAIADLKKQLEARPQATPSQPQSPAPAGVPALTAGDGSNLSVIYPPGYTGQAPVRAGARQDIKVYYGHNPTPQQSSTRDITVDFDHQGGVKSGEWRWVDLPKGRWSTLIEIERDPQGRTLKIDWELMGSTPLTWEVNGVEYADWDDVPTDVKKHVRTVRWKSTDNSTRLRFKVVYK